MTQEKDWTFLVQAAVKAADYAYAPYSHYQVGAALLTKTGQVYTGCNVENVAFGPTICAERTAIVKAVSEGVRQFEAIAVVTRDGGTPCGVCRQVLREFATDLIIIVANMQGTYQLTTLAALLPDSFGPENLDQASPPN